MSPTNQSPVVEDLVIQSFEVLSREQIEAITETKLMSTTKSSVNWEMTEHTECCCEVDE